MVGNRSFWLRVTTALAKHAAVQVACRTSCKVFLSPFALKFKTGETSASSESGLTLLLYEAERRFNVPGS